ncbi:MAG: branched-chain amino acid ABC transporter substrate-binding protein [Bdellovibrionales bacterium]
MKKSLALLAGILFCAAPAHADIVIGLPGPVTGQYATFGEQMKRGARQAVADINAAGGVNGEKLVLHEGDDACDPKQAVTVANQMMSAGVKYVVGHYCSGSAIPASKVYMEEGAILITPAATNPKLTDDAKDVIFRVCGRDDRQGVVDGEYILKHFPGKKVALAHDQSAYGRGIADIVKKTLNDGGVKEELFEAYTPGGRDYSALVSRLKNAGVQVLFIGGYHTEAGLIARQLKEQAAGIQIIGGDALVTDELWKIAGPAAEGMLMSFGPDPRKRPEAKTLVETLRKKGYEPEGYTFYTYAAVQVLSDALKRAGKNDPHKVAAAMRSATAPTVLGSISFDAKGDVTGPAYVLYKWHDGKYAEVGE